MIEVINFGSINIDYVYSMDHFVQPGETQSSLAFMKGMGGKGFNQSVALSRAGVQVCHVGCIGRGDQWVIDQLKSYKLDLSHVQQVDQATGHAIIQVNLEAENCIILYAGANHALSDEQIQNALSIESASWVLLQNETNSVESIIQQAFKRGKKIVFNPAPCHADLKKLPFECIHTLVVNEVEAIQLSGQSTLDAALTKLSQMCPHIVLTMGGEGVRYLGREGAFFEPARKVDVVDTTAAGDTFIGYYLGALIRQLSIPQALAMASLASSKTVGMQGAAQSIPLISELE